jgi:hypothetical protein
LRFGAIPNKRKFKGRSADGCGSTLKAPRSDARTNCATRRFRAGLQCLGSKWSPNTAPCQDSELASLFPSSSVYDRRDRRHVFPQVQLEEAAVGGGVNVLSSRSLQTSQLSRQAPHDLNSSTPDPRIPSPLCVSLYLVLAQLSESVGCKEKNSRLGRLYWLGDSSLSNAHRLCAKCSVHLQLRLQHSGGARTSAVEGLVTRAWRIAPLGATQRRMSSQSLSPQLKYPLRDPRYHLCFPSLCHLHSFTWVFWFLNRYPGL